MTATSFGFNSLVQPASSVSQTVPSGFDVNKAYLLASATSAVVQLYAQGITQLTPAMLAALPLVDTAASYQQLAVFTAPEAIGLGASAATSTQSSSTPGVSLSATLGVALQALAANSNPLFTVIALRGTQTYQEWVNDLTALPQSFALVSGSGWVHSGFYALYTTGTDGQAPTSSNLRVAGSLADQITTAVSATSWPAKVPLYVTGHSLGAALAELCAMDLANNASGTSSSMTMIAFAPPQVSAGLIDNGTTFYNPTAFQTAFQSSVPDSYAVVNAADLVPLMPPTLGSATGIQLDFNPVVSTANTVMYCAQLGTIGANHELTLNYLPYAQALAGGLSAQVVRRRAAEPAPQHAPSA